MQIEDAGPMTADEQLGSPGWTFEKGWLVGVALGLVALVFLSRTTGPRSSGKDIHLMSRHRLPDRPAGEPPYGLPLARVSVRRRAWANGRGWIRRK